MRIAAITADYDAAGDLAGAGEARIGLPMRALADAGHTVAIGQNAAVHTRGWLTALVDGQPWIERPDVVVVQRWMHRDAAEVTRAARATGQRIVHDLDDWFWGLDPSNAAFWGTHPDSDPENNREHYRRAIAAADLLTVSTPYLAERARTMWPGLPVVVLRNMIDTSRYTRQPVRYHPDPLLYGWAGAVNWRSGDLETLRGVLGPVLRDVGGKFYHLGASPQTDRTPSWRLLGLDDDLVHGWRPMVPSHDYPSALTGFDVGLVPLADIPFNAAKSAIKGMEYAAAGIPYAASASEEYRAFGAGIICRRPRDWVKALTRLADPDVREQYAAAAYDRVKGEDVAFRWVEWDETYGRLAA